MAVFSDVTVWLVVDDGNSAVSAAGVRAVAVPNATGVGERYASFVVPSCLIAFAVVPLGVEVTIAIGVSAACFVIGAKAVWL